MQNPDQQYLKECFSYDPITGEMHWLERPPHHFRTARGHKVFNTQQSGKMAGCGSKCAYDHIYLKVRINKRLHLCHRLAWTWMNGEIPAGMEVDHIDGNTLNNSAANLRLVTSGGNSKNSRRRKNVKAPYQGVYWYDRLSAYMVQINTEGKTINLGVHKDLSKAVAVRQAAEKLYGFHANHGRAGALS